ncbi:TetR/AcrR family transcriptional regulator C-terminal domain-containing protein [Citreimonas sp.]|uniref:TetR/AcrR family transcriptional regulator C-terminal domain-containing protein n=1 Tax=Citreimonas sp. TaxID=3036715 RepID=UPI004059BF31
MVIEMLRTVIAEARCYPELSRTLSRSGPVHAASLVEDELARAVEAGEVALHPDEIAGAAEVLVDMVVGNAIPALLDPDRVPRNPDEQAARRDRAIDIFLHGVRPRG